MSTDYPLGPSIVVVGLLRPLLHIGRRNGRGQGCYILSAPSCSFYSTCKTNTSTRRRMRKRETSNLSPKTVDDQKRDSKERTALCAKAGLFELHLLPPPLFSSLLVCKEEMKTKQRGRRVKSHESHQPAQQMQKEAQEGGLLLLTFFHAPESRDAPRRVRAC